MFASTLARHGRVDILCNNAGIGHGFAPLHEIPASAVEAVLDVNLKAAFRVMQRAIAHMLDSGGGAIVNRSEEHTSELQSLMRSSYAVFWLKKKTVETSHLPT